MDTKLPSDLDTQVLAITASFLPYVGGPISNVLNGIGSQRKFKRVKECLSELAEQIRDFESDLSKNTLEPRTLRRFWRRLYEGSLMSTIPAGGSFTRTFWPQL